MSQEFERRHRITRRKAEHFERVVHRHAASSFHQFNRVIHGVFGPAKNASMPGKEK